MSPCGGTDVYTNHPLTVTLPCAAVPLALLPTFCPCDFPSLTIIPCKHMTWFLFGLFLFIFFKCSINSLWSHFLSRSAGRWRREEDVAGLQHGEGDYWNITRNKTMSMQIIQRRQKSQSAGSRVVSSGAVASLAEAPNAEAVGGRRYNLVSVSENLKSRQRATVV